MNIFNRKPNASKPETTGADTLENFKTNWKREENHSGLMLQNGMSDIVDSFRILTRLLKNQPHDQGAVEDDSKYPTVVLGKLPDEFSGRWDPWAADVPVEALTDDELGCEQTDGNEVETEEIVAIGKSLGVTFVCCSDVSQPTMDEFLVSHSTMAASPATTEWLSNHQAEPPVL